MKGKLFYLYYILFLLSILLFSCSLKSPESPGKYEQAEDDSIKNLKVPSEESIRKKNRVHTILEKDSDSTSLLSTYNEEGFITKSVWKKPFWDEEYGEYKTTYFYSYDKANKLQVITSYYSRTYNKNRLDVDCDTPMVKDPISSPNEYTERSHTNYFYTKEGMLDYVKGKDAKTTYTYDVHGLCTSSITELFDTGTYVEFYFYDRNGRKISSDSESKEDLGSHCLSQSVFQYDSIGNLIEQYCDQSVGIKTRFKYEYNSKGLLTKKIYITKVSGKAIEPDQPGRLVRDKANTTTYQYTFYK